MDGYPADGTLVTAAMVVTGLGGGYAASGFTAYQVVREEDGLVIGDVGFIGPPDDDGVVTIDFSLAPAARGHGYATEAVAALVAWALEQSGVSAVEADTEDGHVPSQGVLDRCGLTVVARRDGRRTYRTASRGRAAGRRSPSSAPR